VFSHIVEYTVCFGIGDIGLDIDVDNFDADKAAGTFEEETSTLE
jgi:hypothetical protein